MIHLIILLHFICFTFGASFLALMIMLYKNKKEDMTKDILIGEILFSILFFIDSIGIYVRRILNQYHVEKIFPVINIALFLCSNA